MKRTIILRSVIFAVAALSLLLAAACGGDSEPSTESQTSDTTSSASTSAPPPPPAATSAPPPPAATQAPATVKVGHRVGDQAPEYMLALTGDRQVNSANLVAEGKPVFILFHATW
jgi:hypothetical protein